jgi:hypothetical protein
LDLTSLEPGQTLLSEPLVISIGDAAEYRAAVEDDAVLYAEEHVVPPMAVAAKLMTAAMKAVALPAGAVHTGQELEFARPVAEGAELACTVVVAQNSLRHGTRFLVLELSGTEGEELAVAARTTIAIAEGEGTS